MGRRHPIKRILLKLFGAGTMITGLCCLYVFKRIWFDWKPYKKTVQTYDPRVHLAFGGAGFIYGYYMGVMFYLKDNFILDPSTVRVSGVSAGVFTCGTIMTQGMRMMETAYSTVARIRQFFGKAFLFVPAEAAAAVACQEYKLLGWKDEDLEEMNKNNFCFAGSSEVHWYKLFGLVNIPYFKAVVHPFPSTIEGLSRIVLASCSVPPLFGTPIQLREVCLTLSQKTPIQIKLFG